MTCSTDLPLIIDLNGTLIKTDILLECALLYIKRNPFNIFHIIKWLGCGIYTLKYKLSEKIRIDIKNLPYDKTLVNELKKEVEKNREIVLATASSSVYAFEISDHLKLFNAVLANDNNTNLKGKIRLEKLVKQYGESGFDYIGSSESDLLIFDHSRKSKLITNNKKIIKKALKRTNVLICERPNTRSIEYLKAIRIHQWSKNLLLFVPIMLSQNLTNIQMIARCFFGFLAFCLCASATYVINDLFDLDSDRKHPSKKRRVFAAGDISILRGLVLAFVLTLSGMLISASLQNNFFLYVIVYLVLTVSYSFLLKKHTIIDVLTLTGLYTIRIFAGASLIGIKVSFWLSAFSVFLFFGLSLIKRCAELITIKKTGGNEISGRAYIYEDLNTLKSMGISSSFISIVVFALYINSSEVLLLYPKPEMLWLICPALLYWINRLWLKTGREEMNDDPVIFSLKDTVSRIIFMIILIIISIAHISFIVLPGR